MTTKYSQETKKEIKQTLQDALESLGENGEHWIKGHYWDGHGNMCLSQAIGLYTFAWQYMCDHLGVSYLSCWNDQQTSFAPVKEQLLKAIASLSEEK